MIRFYIRMERPGRAGGFSLEVEYAIQKGGFLGIAGPSGSGKSTLLRILAGLERPDSGYIAHDGTVWYQETPSVHLPPERRSIGYVFQDYALFPHMTVLDNIHYATRDRERVRELLALTRLEAQAHQFPHELSGGQQQRTALARALARRPQLLLLDEPLSALDEDLRAEIGNEIVRIQKATGITALMVSHSRGELGSMCDEVLELDAGRLNCARMSVY